MFKVKVNDENFEIVVRALLESGLTIKLVVTEETAFFGQITKMYLEVSKE